MEKRVIVIGAGQGGMQAAKVLAENGCSVTIYESSQREKLGHDQLDAVESGFFDEMGISVPEGAKKAAPAAFVAPFSEKTLLMWSELDDRDWSIERRVFSREQVERCENAGVEFVFGTPVNELIFSKDKVVGIKVNGEDVFADLVIDSSGVHSALRKSFHGKFGITESPEECEVFNIVHTYYAPAEGVTLPEQYKYYLKYKGSKGISWCGIEVDDTVSTLIGKVGALTEEEYESLFLQLKEENPIISDKVLRGGHHTAIPVRYPAPIMVSDGYASVGDCAFMTIPLLGNGIASSVRAGQILADTIIENDSVDIKVLWKYEVKFFKKIGALFCLIDFIKRGLLESEDDDIRQIFESEVVNDDDIKAVFSGKLPKLTPNEIGAKISNACKAKKFFGTMGSNALKGVKAMLIAIEIPDEYDVSTVFKWKQKLEKMYR